MSKVLLMIDVQKGFEDSDWWGPRNNPDAEQRMEQLLRLWRERGWPVIHVRHCSTEPNSPLWPDKPGSAFKKFATPLEDEPNFTKNTNSAFIGTPLEEHLREHGLQQLVVVGLTTDHCVSTSVRMAANLGFEVTLVADATATHDREGLDGQRIEAETIHQVHLASLHQEFCQVTTADQLLSSL